MKLVTFLFCFLTFGYSQILRYSVFENNWEERNYLADFYKFDYLRSDKHYLHSNFLDVALLGDTLYKYGNSYKDKFVTINEIEYFDFEKDRMDRLFFDGYKWITYPRNVKKAV